MIRSQNMFALSLEDIFLFFLSGNDQAFLDADVDSVRREDEVVGRAYAVHDAVLCLPPVDKISKEIQNKII